MGEHSNGSEPINDDKAYKILIIGDEGCGKTSLIYAYLQKAFPDGSRPIPCKEYAAKTEGLSVVPHDIVLWDVPMKVEDANRRKTSYANSDVVILCFAINDPPSLERACTRWLLEIKQSVPDAQIVLVGLKKDLRTIPKDEEAADAYPFVTYQTALQKKEFHDFKDYIECSAKRGEGIHAVFKVVAHIIEEQGIWI